MPKLFGEIIPRPDLTTNQLKDLGAAVRRAWHAGLIGDPGEAALADLLAGELPQPLALHFITLGADGPRGRISTRPEFRDPSLRAELTRRSLRFVCECSPGITPANLFAALCLVIPMDLVEDVRITDGSMPIDPLEK